MKKILWWFKPPNKPLRKGRTAMAITLLLLTLTAMTALAAEYFINSEGQTEEINGALFVGFFPDTPTGTGNFDPFLRISQSNLNIVKGFNTDAEPQFQEDDTWTTAQNISEIPVVAYEYPEGTIRLYRELQLDINQNAGGDGRFLSLDVIEVYITEDPNLTGYDPIDKFGTNATLVYDMDELEDNWLKFDYTNNNGSGKRDMKMLIPNEWLTEDPRCAYQGPVPDGSPPSDCPYYFVMYNEFGANYDNNDGFEEWGNEIYPVASKNGTKYNDLNKNGQRDEGEPGLEGWTIYLDLNNNGEQDVGEPFGITDATGYYEINYIIPNPTPEDTWIVREVQHEGWLCSEPATSDAFGCYYDENFAADEIKSGNDFGNYYPMPLTATKTANGSYDRTVTWTLEKSVDPASHSGYAGQVAGSSTWTVVATKSETLGNYQVAGTITINNPNGFDVPVTVSDTLNDGTSATVTCDATSVPAGGSLNCSYTASPTDGSADLNTADIASGDPDVSDTSATQAITWSENLIGYDSGDLSDPHLGYAQLIDDTTTVTQGETFECSADASMYTNGHYQYTVPNTAYLDSNIGLEASLLFGAIGTEQGCCG